MLPLSCEPRCTRGVDMTDVRYFNPACLPAPPGLFTWVAQAGRTVYLSGQVGIDHTKRAVGPDAESQARQIYLNIEATLKELGGDLNSLVRTTVYVVGRDNIAGHRRARKEVVDA